jgi:hypothetical protein
MTPLSYQAMVDSMVGQGIRRDLAERTARRELKVELPTEEDERRDNALEKAEQWEIVKLFKAFGFAVYTLSQPRATKQTPGLPDLWLMHRELDIAFWWETKRSRGGRYSDAQIEFRDGCARCGVGYGSGDRAAARTHLIQLGLARIEGSTLEPVR